MSLDQSNLNLNELFVTWLSEEVEALASKRSRMFHAYKKAADRLSAYPEQITTPKQLKSVSFVGEKIFLILCSRLQKHCEQNSVDIPALFGNYVTLTRNEKRPLQLDEEKAKKTRRTNKWIPKRRSGGWAILVALCKNQHVSGLCKEDLIAAATPYCDGSFTSNPAARDFYSAWDSIKTLLNREYVYCRGRPKIYLITETGLQMAQGILLQEGLDFETNLPERPEVSYDNGVRLTPESVTGNSLFVKETESTPLSELILSSPLSQRTQVTVTNSFGKSEIGSSVQASLTIAHDADKKYFGGVKYDIWCPEDYEIILLMDNREVRSQTERDYFHTRIVANGVNCDTRSLSVGDVLWIARHKTTGLEVVLNYVCERKRLDDLAMSIRDGRFTEQKSRLKNSGLKNIYYLVEEGGLGDLQRIADMKQAIETSISMVITNSKFHLNRFKRTDDTIEWLQCMTSILKIRYQGLRLIVLKPDCVNTRDDYISMLQNFRAKFEDRPSYECVHKFSLYQATMTKTTMMTVKEIFILMLLLIRGMSLEKAIVLQNHFKVPRILIEYFLEFGAGKTEVEKGVLIFDLFKDEIGSKKFTKPLLIAVYDTWGRE